MHQYLGCRPYLTGSYGYLYLYLWPGYLYLFSYLHFWCLYLYLCIGYLIQLCWRVLKSGHVMKWSSIITKNENLRIDTLRKIHRFQNAILFDLRRNITKLSQKNRFQTVASPGACERLAVLNWRSSSIHASSLCSSQFFNDDAIRRFGP